jgi:glutamine amidotransferase
MISIIDYGLGNLGSIKNMIEHIEEEVQIISDISLIKHASKFILPGVGAFDTAMKKIHKIDGLYETLNEQIVLKKKPLLGVCLGMQLLMDISEEGKEKGFGWITGKVKKFPKNKSLKVPHMGWNTVSFDKESSLTRGLDRKARFYFVHSYYVKPKDKKKSILSTSYSFNFVSAIQEENIFGVQFHPEKSHSFGMKILKNFSDF